MCMSHLLHSPSLEREREREGWEEGRKEDGKKERFHLSGPLGQKLHPTAASAKAISPSGMKSLIAATSEV